MNNKYQVNDEVTVNGFNAVYIVIGMEYDNFLGVDDMIFYDLQNLESGQIIRTYEHNIEKI